MKPKPSPRDTARVGRRRWAMGLALGLVTLSACSPDKPKFNTIDLTGADYARDFALKDVAGKPRSLAEFRGQAVVVFFGFTQCPDVCPTTLTEMAQVKKLLGADGQRLRVVFITVDPQRDTPEVLQAYMSNFNPAFVALLPSDKELADVAKEFKVIYRKVPGKTATSYVMEHTAASYVFDPQGRLRLYARYGTDVKLLADDVRRLLRGD